MMVMSVPVAARSKAWVCGRSPAEIVDSNPTSGIDVCDEVITRPEESYWLWCVIVRDLETSGMKRPWPTGGLLRKKEKKKKKDYGDGDDNIKRHALLSKLIVNHKRQMMLKCSLAFVFESDKQNTV